MLFLRKTIDLLGIRKEIDLTKESASNIAKQIDFARQPAARRSLLRGVVDIYRRRGPVLGEHQRWVLQTRLKWLSLGTVACLALSIWWLLTPGGGWNALATVYAALVFGVPASLCAFALLPRRIEPVGQVVEAYRLGHHPAEILPPVRED